MLTILTLLQAAGPDLCLLSGQCGIAQRFGPASGWMFLAVGLVAVGVGGLWWRRRRAGGPAD